MSTYSESICASAAARLGLLLAALMPASAFAGDLPTRKPPSPPPVLTTPDWTMEVGTRLWVSSGRFRSDLFNPYASGLRDGRRTYDNLQAIAPETFLRIDHRSGFFAKGAIGAGSIGRGHAIDENFPPSVSSYSRTIQSNRDGSLQYGVLDVGYLLWSADAWRVEGLVGYTRWGERYRGFGCQQAGGANGTCNAVLGFTVPVSSLYGALDQNMTVDAARVGLAGQATLGDRVTVRLEGAYLRGGYDGSDSNNLLPAINGLRQSGAVNGFQLEGLVAYRATQALEIGLGGRWWRADAAARRHWEDVAPGAPSASQPSSINRYGMFVQASYRFGAGDMAARWSDAPHDWSGAHVGLSGGVGLGRGGGDVVATSAVAADGFVTGAQPRTAGYETFGALGGLQAGYDWQIDRFVLGLEADASRAHIAGSASSGERSGLMMMTTRQTLNWLATARARFGVSIGPTLLYATAGVAASGVAGHTAASAPIVSCSYIYCSIGALPSRTTFGGVWGAGAEVAVDARFSFKGEYMFVDAGKSRIEALDYGVYAVRRIPVDYAASISHGAHVLRFGLNYRFGRTGDPS